jgi:hypothetical protein
MREQQLDLFSATGVPPEHFPRPDSRPQELVAADLDDGALVAVIPGASLAEASALAAEPGGAAWSPRFPPWSSSAGALRASASIALCLSRPQHSTPSP